MGRQGHFVTVRFRRLGVRELPLETPSDCQAWVNRKADFSRQENEGVEIPHIDHPCRERQNSMKAYMLSFPTLGLTLVTGAQHINAEVMQTPSEGIYPIPLQSRATCVYAHWDLNQPMVPDGSKETHETFL